MSPADLDLARELRSRMPETIYDLSESWVVEGDGRRVVRGRLAGMRYVFSNGFSNGGHEFSAQRSEPIWVPDLDDPATAGVLLGMLADAGGECVPPIREWEDGARRGAPLARALLTALGPG